MAPQALIETSASMENALPGDDEGEIVIHPQDMVEESKLGFKGGGEVPKPEPEAFIDNAQKKGDFYCELCDVKLTNKSQKKRHIGTAEHK